MNVKSSWNTTSRRIGSSLVVVVLTLFGLAAPAATDDQVPFTATGTGEVTGVTHLPGGLTQVDFSGSGTATHLGSYTGSAMRVQDHQGSFTTLSVFIGPTGRTVCSCPSVGTLRIRASVCSLPRALTS